MVEFYFIIDSFGRSRFAIRDESVIQISDNAIETAI